MLLDMDVSLDINVESFAAIGGEAEFYSACGVHAIPIGSETSAHNKKIILAHSNMMNVRTILKDMDNRVVAGMVKRTEEFEKNDISGLQEKLESATNDIDSSITNLIQKKLNKPTEGCILWFKPGVHIVRPPPLLLYELVHFFMDESHATFYSTGHHVFDLFGKTDSEKVRLILRQLNDKAVTTTEEHGIGKKKKLDLAGLWQLSDMFLPGLRKTIQLSQEQDIKRRDKVVQLKADGKKDEAKKLAKTRKLPSCSTLTATLEMSTTACKVLHDIKIGRFHVIDSDGNHYYDA